MTPPALLRDTLIVAGVELGQSARTRLLQVTVLAYAAVIAAANWIFVQIVHVAETEAALALGVPPTAKPGAMLDTVVAGGEVRRAVAEMVGDASLAENLLSAPPLALWSGLVSMGLLPVVLLAATSASVAAEVQSGSIRYWALRTERLPIVLGKFLGQVAAVALAAALGLAVTAVCGATLMVRVPQAELFISGAEFAARGLCFALPFGALGMAISQVLPGPNVARLGAILLVLALAILDGVIEHFAAPGSWGQAADLAGLLLPGHGWTAMWQVDHGQFALALGRVAIVTTGWIALGFLRFSSRDL